RNAGIRRRVSNRTGDGAVWTRGERGQTVRRTESGRAVVARARRAEVCRRARTVVAGRDVVERAGRGVRVARRVGAGDRGAGTRKHGGDDGRGRARAAEARPTPLPKGVIARDAGSRVGEGGHVGEGAHAATAVGLPRWLRLEDRATATRTTERVVPDRLGPA